MKTYSAKAKDIPERWHVVDAADQPLGRIATRIASLLRGKHRPEFTPHLDMRDFVVVVNAEKVSVSGNNKMRQKLYRHHTRFPGGLKEITLEKMMATHPTRVIEHAVRGMLPHNRLGNKLRRHLKVYVGPEHPHYAQTGDAPNKPKKVEKPVAQAEPEVVAEAVVEETSEAVAEASVEAAVTEETAEETPEVVPEASAAEAAESVTSEEPLEAAPQPEEIVEEPRPDGGTGGEAP